MKTIGAEDSKFRYYNRRPDGKHLQDCVCRAISTATTLPYEACAKLLNLTADMYSCETLCICCYHHLLEDLFTYRCYHCYNEERVRDIARAFPHDRVIIRVQGHLTCAINGVIPDIWDCADEIVDCFWIVH